MDEAQLNQKTRESDFTFQQTSLFSYAESILKDICRAATWYSVHTFTKHYCLDSAWKEDAAVGQAVLRHLFASGCAALKRFETTAIRGHMLHIAGADEVHDKKTTTRDLNTSLTVLPERRPCARHDTCTTRRQQQETSIHHSQYCQREGPVHGMTQQAPEEGPMGPEMHWTALHEKIF
ncbi:uncharacterized protein LOC144792272 isoform X2 [Lissotriton helveticus]